MARTDFGGVNWNFTSVYGVADRRMILCHDAECVEGWLLGIEPRYRRFTTFGLHRLAIATPQHTLSNWYLPSDSNRD